MTPRSTCGARRRLDLERRLDRARKSEAVGHGGIAGDARDDARGLLDLDIGGQQPVDALVHIAEPLLQPRHGLAVCRETEMAGLDDAGMHGTDRNLVQPLALDGQEFVARRITHRAAGSGRRAAHATPQAP